MPAPRGSIHHSIVSLLPSTPAHAHGDELRRKLAEKDQELVLVYEDYLVDQVWGDGRPQPPSKPLRVHELRYAGVDVATKLANLRKELVCAGATAMVVTMLDEVAWLLNVIIARGVEVEVALCIRIPKEEYELHLRYSVLEHYLYVGRHGDMLLALGVGSLFNHSQ